MEKQKKMEIPYTEKELKVEIPYIEKKIMLEELPIQQEIQPEAPPIQQPIQPQVTPPPIQQQIKAEIAVKIPSVEKQKKMHYDQYIYYQMVPVCYPKMYDYCRMMAQYHQQMYMHYCKGLPKPQMPIMKYYPMMYQNPMYKMDYDMDECD